MTQRPTRPALIAAILLLFCLPMAPASAATAPHPHPLWGYSIDLPPYDSTYVPLLAQSGAATVRAEFSWAQINPQPGVWNWSTADSVFLSAAQAGQRVLILASQAPGWANGGNGPWTPPTNTSAFYGFVRALMLRYGGAGYFWALHPTLTKRLPVGLEVWNEPNLTAFWPGGSDPRKYVGLLYAAHRAVRSVNNYTPVIGGSVGPHGCYNDADCNGHADGGIDSTGQYNPTSFIQAIYRAGAKRYMNAVSVHPYSYLDHGTADQVLAKRRSSTWTQIAQTPVSIRSLMVAYGDATKKMWITEVGAPSCYPGINNYPCLLEPEQASLASKQLAIWSKYPWAGGYYWYNFHDSAGGIGGLIGATPLFGAVRTDNSTKPVYAALKYAFTR